MCFDLLILLADLINQLFERLIDGMKDCMSTSVAVQELCIVGLVVRW